MNIKIVNNAEEAEFDQKKARAVEEAARVLSEAFGRQMYRAVINPDRSNPKKLYGIAYSFRLND